VDQVRTEVGGAEQALVVLQREALGPVGDGEGEDVAGRLERGDGDPVEGEEGEDQPQAQERELGGPAGRRFLADHVRAPRFPEPRAAAVRSRVAIRKNTAKTSRMATTRRPRAEALP